MTDKAELAARFDRVLSALQGIIATEAALEPAWEESLKGARGAYGDALVSRGQARMAFEDETPTMDALVITLKDNRYKDSSWPPDDADDAKILRSVWHFIHDTIVAGKPFTPADLSAMRNLHAALERAREDLTNCDTPDDASKPTWDRVKGELSFGGETVRRIRRIGSAKNVVLVLDTFQELDWPDRVDSPLSPGSQKHHATIRSLNTDLSRIRFKSDGEGIGFIWATL